MRLKIIEWKNNKNYELIMQMKIVLFIKRCNVRQDKGQICNFTLY